ncbi:MAG: hypothetical protein ACYDD4_08900 [Acidimicrobiales bacterium]
MSGLSRRRRRRRALRQKAPLLIPAVVVTMVLLVVAAGASQVGRESHGANSTLDRGWAALGAVVGDESSATGAALDALLSAAAGQARVELFSSLDTLAAAADRQAAELADDSPPPPPGGVAAPCAAALTGRAGAVSTIRSAIEGVLGGPDGSASVGAATATAELSQAASAVSAADAEWATCRKVLRASAGRAQLPSSAWVTGASQWRSGALTALVSHLIRSPALAVHRGLALSAAGLVPTALSGSAGPPVVANLGPTTSLTVHVVVFDTGDVEEPGVTVTLELRPLQPSSGAAAGSSSTVVAPSLAPGRAVALPFGPLPVAPGGSYVLSIVAAGPGGVPGASATEQIVVAALPPPPTTTTTSTTTTTTTPGGRTRRSGP